MLKTQLQLKEVDDYVANLNGTSVKGLRIGIPKQYFNVAGLDADVKARVEESLKKLEEMGAALVEIDLNMTGSLCTNVLPHRASEASSNLSRYDGVRYGYRCETQLT